ncbi:MAG: hypothetical protein HUK22_03035, partial [Thermoguttaceae bacterium]|nr:hypothetical protein [Thermoguttaceae bacterium]
MQRILGLIVIISLFAAAVPASEPLFPKDAVVLFQGDSITDGARGRSADPNHILGHGYAFAIASELGGDRPEMNWTFVNRGVSGDTLVQLKNRWENDALALKPDVLSILIGVNDVARGEETADEYRERYDALLAQTREALPNVLLVIVEPFATEPFVSGAPDRAEKISLFQRAARELAEKYDA